MQTFAVLLNLHFLGKIFGERLARYFEKAYLCTRKHTTTRSDEATGKKRPKKIMINNILTLAPAVLAVAAMSSFVALALYQFAKGVAPYVRRLWSWLSTPHTYGAEEAGDDSGVTLTGWQLVGVSLLTVALSLVLCIDYDALLNNML